MAKNADAKQPKEKKQKRSRIKETFGELKKVSWPSFGTVVKQTGIVLSVVVIFLVTLMLFDALLGWLYEVLVKGLNSGVETTGVIKALVSTNTAFDGVGALWL